MQPISFLKKLVRVLFPILNPKYGSGKETWVVGSEQIPLGPQEKSKPLTIPVERFVSILLLSKRENWMDQISNSLLELWFFDSSSSNPDGNIESKKSVSGLKKITQG